MFSNRTADEDGLGSDEHDAGAPPRDGALPDDLPVLGVVDDQLLLVVAEAEQGAAVGESAAEDPERAFRWGLRLGLLVFQGQRSGDGDGRERGIVPKRLKGQIVGIKGTKRGERFRDNYS